MQNSHHTEDNCPLCRKKKEVLRASSKQHNASVTRYLPEEEVYEEQYYPEEPQEEQYDYDEQ